MLSAARETGTLGLAISRASIQNRLITNPMPAKNTNAVPPKNRAIEYLNAVYRYPLVAVCTFVVGLTMTLWTVRTLPNRYSSTTLIMVKPQEIAETFVRPVMKEDLEDALKALNQEVLSRTRLEAIIDDLDLYPDLRKDGVSRAQIVETMRRKIKIEVFSRNGFRITYEGDTPAVVQQVTTRLAGLYIAENLRFREQYVAGTTEFIDDEMEKAKRPLEEREAELQKFKREHQGELPEQRESNMRALDVLVVQLQTLGNALSAAKQRKMLLDKQVAEARAGRPVSRQQSGVAPGDPSLSLHQLEAQLAELLSRYTPDHPDVIRTERRIEQLRANLGATRGNATASAAPLVPPDLARAVADTELEIARLTEQQARVEKDIDAHQGRVENTFTSEQQLQSLTRDYGVMQQQYQLLLNKKIEAQLGQSLEKRQKGERFHVLDPASFPESPSKPNRRALSLGGVFGSLALALGLPILLAQMDTSFHGADELTGYALPVFAVIPQAQTLDVVRRRRRYRVRVLALSAAALVAGLGTVSLYARYVF